MYAVRGAEGDRETERGRERLAKPVNTYYTPSHNYLNDVLCGKRFCSFVFFFSYII